MSADEWETPPSFFKILNDIFRFTLDPCATHENTKVPFNYYTIEEDGLKQDWEGNVVFMNPPYGNKAKLWMYKAVEESKKPRTTIVCLIAARTDSIWFHETAFAHAKRIIFLKGRVKFLHPVKTGDSPRYPSCIVVLGYNDPLKDRKLLDLCYGGLGRMCIVI